jgi:diaminohydroxyphosphoribosylaminopyrimidine deaminase/5-amino-6-(5-phosphoribosylamino)uracil reductase
MTYMLRAIELAQRALGTTSPNPAVGAVVVNNGQIVGEGFTQPAGDAHAEVLALREAGPMAQGGTLYVTLEPCCHHGKTPPCIQAIIESQISAVHFAITDPNKLVDGKGKKLLIEAGIKVIEGEEYKASKRLNEGYFKFTTTGLPFLIAKFATSLDGKIATRTGDAKWITGESARMESHRLRASSDAILVGIGTVLADDPNLTARDTNEIPLQRQPLRIILDSSGRTPITARMFQEPGNILIVGSCIPDHRIETLQSTGAEVIQAPSEHGEVDLGCLVNILGERKIATLIVEGGSTILGSFFDNNLIDKVVAFIAPLIVGGTMATVSIGGLGSATIAESMYLRDVETSRVGEDLMLVGYPTREG